MVDVNNVTSSVITTATIQPNSRSSTLVQKSDQDTDIKAKIKPEEATEDIKNEQRKPFEKKIDSLLQAQEEGQASPFDSELTPEEQQEVQELQQTDREVRAHEAAHKTVGGPYAGTVSYETVTGPDGREYAVAGEVQIDASPVPNNPKATIRKMDVIIRAAFAPAEPSPQDRAVAAQAQQTRLQAQQEVLHQSQQERKKTVSDGNNSQNNKNNVQTSSEIKENRANLKELGNDPADEIVYILFGRQR